MENRTPPIRGSVINSLGIEVLGYIGALVSPALPEREFPVSVWYAFEKEKRKIALTREKQKHPKATKKKPKSTKTPPKDEKNTLFFFALTREKNGPLPKKQLVLLVSPEHQQRREFPALDSPPKPPSSDYCTSRTTQLRVEANHHLSPPPPQSARPRWSTPGSSASSCSTSGSFELPTVPKYSSAIQTVRTCSHDSLLMLVRLQNGVEARTYANAPLTISCGNVQKPLLVRRKHLFQKLLPTGALGHIGFQHSGQLMASLHHPRVNLGRRSGIRCIQQ